MNKDDENIMNRGQVNENEEDSNREGMAFQVF